jgi:HAD superfamily hydrolase (TIGR01484 family)
MLPPFIDTAPTSALRAVQGVFTDIDDTLTCAGTLMPAAFDALQQLQAAGIPVIAITGRPMGWSEPFARTWPLTALVAENGAVALFRDAHGALQVEYAQDALTRAAHAQRLREVAQQVLQQIPGATLAQDSAGRVTDLAIDHSEFTQLEADRIAQVVALMRAHGMCVTVSSIHINGWFGTHSKLSGAHWMVQRLWRRSLGDEVARWLYVGDSPNDQEMFGHFSLSVGVANLQRFATQLTVWPAYLTRGERGEGFAQAVQALFAARV